MSTVAIVTRRDDVHATRVAARLRADGHRVVPVDLAQFPMHVKSTVLIDNLGRPDLWWGDVYLNEADSVWLRRISWPRVSESLPGWQREFAAVQAHTFVQAASLVRTRALWANPPAALATQDAGLGKLQQLSEAAQLNLAIPATCATTDPEEAQAFVAGKRCIFKPFRSTAQRALYTTVLAPDADLTTLSAAPGILQELVPKRADIRVVLCGRTGLASAIRSQAEPESSIDFRRNYDVPHEPHELPEVVWTALGLLQDALGLVMGVHDLIQKPDGSYVYLETNQQGQWLWLQEQTKQDYVGLVASFLASGNPRFGNPAVGATW